jgi:hypothetical protein
MALFEATAEGVMPVEPPVERLRVAVVVQEGLGSGEVAV